MDDAEFLQALEACTLPPADFGHTGHVRAGYLCLRGTDFGVGLLRFRAALQRYAAHLGVPGKYHETITVAWLSLIQQHLTLRGDGGGWRDFAAANPELLSNDLLLRFYAKDELATDLARQAFVLPRSQRTSSAIA